MELKLERIYTKPADKDGYRILVDRLWPRGISKVNADLGVWFKSIAPSTDLRSGSDTIQLSLMNSNKNTWQN
ncbi:hypothetical protein IV37_GL000498 [Fructilactobacillus fructivorans]|nr:hypothetical protein IV37_GL000498 [Fructilactobacillus fructivorans]